MNAPDRIRDMYSRYQKAQRTGSGEAVAALFTADAMLIPPEQLPLKGRADIGGYYEGSVTSGVEMDLSHIEVEGRLAYATGLGHWDADGSRRCIAFLDVWRRENGEWQIAACMWNSPEGFATA
jgi:ketosteroid isomerase-like protein